MGTQKQPHVSDVDKQDDRGTGAGSAVGRDENSKEVPGFSTPTAVTAGEYYYKVADVESVITEEFDDFLASTELSELAQSHVVGLYQLVLTQLRIIDQFFSPVRRPDDVIVVDRDAVADLLRAIDNAACCLNTDGRPERAEDLKYAVAKLMKGFKNK